ncbi:MAG: SRPBCC family protein [Verrucomicrobiota bacterium]
MKYTVEVEINQPRDRVAELFDSQDNLGAWQPGFVSCEHLEGDVGKPGAKSKLTYKNKGRDVAMVETILDIKMPEVFKAKFEAPGMVMTVENIFEEIDAKTTRIISNNEAEVSSFMMRMMALLMPGCFKKESTKFLLNFKAFAEDGTDLRDQSSPGT